MWILGSDADEAAGAASMERVAGVVGDNGGKMVKSAPWGRRTLSYPIKKNKEGSYFLAYLEVDSERTPAIDRALVADQEIIRHLLTLHPDPVPVDGQTDNPDEEVGRGRRGGPR